MLFVGLSNIRFVIYNYLIVSNHDDLEYVEIMNAFILWGKYD